MMKTICSWSGGKDSTMALYLGSREHTVSQLLTITSPEGPSRSHGIPRGILKRQGEEMSIAWRGAAAEWETYEEVFLKNLKELKDEGFEAMIFGDIDIEGHREWAERICAKVGLRALLPLWQVDQKSLVEEFIAAGFKATIVSLNTEFLPIEFLGEELTLGLLEDLIERGITPAGELGEYHTLVTGGPLFGQEIRIKREGRDVHKEKGHAFLKFSLVEE